ncbi:MAG: hypothetical protein V7L02_31185 [Nostoc sp.]|uniref:hypothetical protein n=1 Tax=Nostoc sp. TaxID=1180 RepID=UPI002FFCC4C9
MLSQLLNSGFEVVRLWEQPTEVFLCLEEVAKLTGLSIEDVQLLETQIQDEST